MKKLFQECKTLEDLKKLYFKLLKQYHPDISGSDTTETCKEINNLYEEFFEKVKNIRTNKDGEQYTKETTETPEQYRDFITKILHLYGIKIEICGAWIWISGDTKPYKALFSELACKWSANKSMWYYTTDTYKNKFKRTPWTIETIRASFGSINIETDPHTQI